MKRQNPTKNRNENNDRSPRRSVTRENGSHNVVERLEGQRPARLIGLLPVLEALRSGKRRIDEILVAENIRDSRLQEIFERARSMNVRILRVQRSALGRDVDEVHQGIVAHVAAHEYYDAEQLITDCETLIKSGTPPLLTILDGLEDPRNLGAVLRTVEGVGGHGVVVPERRSVGLTEVVAKTSAGAIEHVPVARVTNISKMLDELKKVGIWTVGAAGEATTPYTEWDWTQPSALVLGSEGNGIHRLVREHCDTLVRIPMAGKIESLNVSVAAGVILFEAMRQRRRPGG